MKQWTSASKQKCLDYIEAGKNTYHNGTMMYCYYYVYRERKYSKIQVLRAICAALEVLRNIPITNIQEATTHGAPVVGGSNDVNNDNIDSS